MDLIFSCIICFVGIALGAAIALSDSHPKEITYSLISCDHITKCETVGVFQTNESCLDMKKQLESMSKMNSYICEKVDK